jgi:hypothetical protein
VSWLSHVPGFRSDTYWKEVVAIVGYVLSVTLLLAPDARLKVLAVALLIAGWLASDAWGLRRRAPGFGSSSKGIAVGSWAAFGSLTLLLVALLTPTVAPPTASARPRAVSSEAGGQGSSSVIAPAPPAPTASGSTEALTPTPTLAAPERSAETEADRRTEGVAR